MVQKNGLIHQLASSDRRVYLLLILLSAVYYIGLGQVHLFDWDEINFAECAREMIASGDYFRVQINYDPFWEKTPFFFWLQVLCMKIFGVGEYAARLPNALFGTLTLFTLYWIGRKIKDSSFGLMWAVVYFGSLLPHLYFKSGIIDPVFNYFIFLSVYFVIRAMQKERRSLSYAALGGLFSGLAILTKGPVGLLLLMLTIGAYIVVRRFKVMPPLKEVLVFTASALLITMGWFAIDMAQNGTEILEKFIVYQIELFSSPVAGHEQPFFYHFVVVLIGCFPLSVFAIGSFSMRDSDLMDMRLWMKSLFWVVIILFSIVTTKIVHYSSMTYLPLSYMATQYLFTLDNTRIRKWMIGLYSGIGLLLGIVIVLLPIVPVLANQYTELIMDPFAKAALELPVQWTGWEFIAGIPFLAAVLLSIRSLRKSQWVRAQFMTASGLALTLLMVLFLVLPKIERYSQGTAIDFYISLQGEDVYVDTYGFKSYAQYFYFRLPADADPRRNNRWYLMEKEVDKPVYFVTKVNNTELNEHPNFEMIEEKGGFKFFKRK